MARLPMKKEPRACVVGKCVSRYPEWECPEEGPSAQCAAAHLLRLATAGRIELAQSDPEPFPITGNPYGDALVSAGLVRHLGRSLISAVQDVRPVPKLKAI